MKITNARIKNVTVGFDNRDRLSARMNFEGLHCCYDVCFILSNTTDVQRLMKIMNYAEAYEVEDLSGKVIRIVEYGNLLRGFGHLIEDKFVPIFTDDFKEINKSEFKKIVNS